MKNTKNVILYIVIVILIAVVIIGIVEANNFHSVIAMVTEIDEENSLITTTCASGNMFSFYDTNGDWCCGDLCSLIMYNNGTDIVYDDAVVGARYGGFVELFEEMESNVLTEDLS